MTNFDEKAKDWDSSPVKLERARVIAEAIRNQVPMHHAISAFEYGCGTGLLSFELQPYLSHITLADSSTGMLRVLDEKIASSGIRNMKSVKLDLCSDPLPPKQFGLVYMLMTLHHIPDTEAILHRFNSILENGGYLCIADLDKEDGSYHGADFHGHPGFNRIDLQEKLEKTGFRDIGFSTVYEMVKETGKGPKPFTLFLMVAQKGQ